MDAYEWLRGSIRSGDLLPGQRVAEADLAKAMGLSRTPVREALSRLDGDGLVNSKGRGVQLRVLTAAELADVLECRAALEGYAAARAAQLQAQGMVRPADLTAVEALMTACDLSTRVEGPVGGAVANRGFHLAVASLAGNAVLDAELSRMWDQVLVATRAGLDLPARMADVHSEHQAIMDAIRLGDPRAARTAVEQHIDTTTALAVHSHVAHGIREGGR